MYITYETAQYTGDEDRVNGIKRPKPLRTVPNVLPKPDFMPTKLVCVNDMKVVDGSQVNEGYCALSYSWNQSGEIIYDELTGKYERIDEGKHGIVSHNNILRDMIITYNDLALVLGRYKISESKILKIDKVLKIMEENDYFFKEPIKYVKFEGIIQRICQQFNIKYIWIDQMCINQDNKEEKKREIRNMHHIYGNAYCTVALVHKNDDTFNFSMSGEEEYFKRLWTLEEAIKSERILFVARNEHLWGDTLYNFSSNYILVKRSSELGVSQILYHAHKRTSTKEHDRVFALIHLFPEFMQHIDIDYDQPFEDLMIRFYGLLAKKDISILFFTSKSYINEYNSTIQKYKFLPSWTGVHGQHKTYDVKAPFQDYNTIGKTMHLTSSFVTNDQPIDNDALTLRKEDLPPLPDNISDDNNIKYDYILHISVVLPGSNEARIIRVSGFCYNEYYMERGHGDMASKELKQLSKFMDIKKENLVWYHKEMMAYIIDFDMLTEDVDDPYAQYVILSEIAFKYNDRQYYPVILKKEGEEYYTTIGCCEILSDSKKDIFSDCNLPKQTFLIQ